MQRLAPQSLACEVTERCLLSVEMGLLGAPPPAEQGSVRAPGRDLSEIWKSVSDLQAHRIRGC